MLAFLSDAFIAPLFLIYGMLFEVAPFLGPGGRIVLFSLLLNLLLVPVYRQMETKSREGAELRRRVERDVARMRQHFRGRERYFYVRAVHRQHGYQPLSHLFGSADLFVQVLVFATVYRYLSRLPELAGASFGPLADLSRPDGLLGGIHLMPFLMTAINLAAVFAYIEEKSRRIQALVLAGLFLVLLYASPAGLVLYWTINNLFSLLRTLAQRYWTRRSAGGFAQRLAGLRQQE